MNADKPENLKIVDIGLICVYPLLSAFICGYGFYHHSIIRGDSLQTMLKYFYLPGSVVGAGRACAGVG
jgi:hypothetical protein